MNIYAGNMASAFQPGYAPQMLAQNQTANAKTLKYDQPGSAATAFGYTPQNIYTNLDKLYKDYKVGGITSGGNKGIWKALEKETAKHLGEGNTQAPLFQQYLQTGKMPPGLDPNYAVQMLDYGVREVSRGQQNKEGFFDSTFGKIVGIGATALGGVLGGPVGGALAGGLVGGVSGGGPLGVALGAVGGYAGAGGLNSIGVPTNIFNVPNPLAGGVSNLGSALGGTVSNVNSFMPADIAARAASGGNMGALSSIGNFLADNAGGLINAGVNLYGQNKAMDAQQQAANQAFANSQFTPYNINGPMGGASFNGTNATGALSPQAQAIAAQYQNLANQNLSAYQSFNPDNYAQSYYDTIYNMKAPMNEWEDQNLLSDTFNTGRWNSTVGQQGLWSADMARGLQDQAMRFQAQQAGAQESDRLFNTYMKANAAYNSVLQTPYDYINQGLSAGANRSSANMNANQYPWLAAQNDSDATMAFWSQMGDLSSKALSSVFNSNANAQNARQNYINSPSSAFGNPNYGAW